AGSRELAQRRFAFGNTRGTSADHDGDPVRAEALNYVVERRPDLPERPERELIVATSIGQRKFFQARQEKFRVDATERERSSGQEIPRRLDAALGSEHAPGDVVEFVAQWTDHSESIEINHA